MEIQPIQRTGGAPLPWQTNADVRDMMYEVRIKKNDAEKLMPCNNYHRLALRAYEELLRLRNYSWHTVKNYKYYFLFFMNAFPDRKPSGITKPEIMDFLVAFCKSDKWSSIAQNQLVNAIHPVGLKK